jgi:AcrR family transcriptional regulator
MSVNRAMSRATAEHSPSDRRARRTDKALREALLALAAERAWDDISVQDICSAADVGRSTFYAHYNGKEALLAAGLRAYFEALYAEAPRSHEPFGYLSSLIDHVHEQRRVFRSVAGRRSGYVIQARLRETLRDLVERDLAGRVPNSNRDLAVRCVAGALFEALVLAAEKGRSIDPDALRRQLARLAE